MNSLIQITSPTAIRSRQQLREACARSLSRVDWYSMNNEAEATPKGCNAQEMTSSIYASVSRSASDNSKFGSSVMHHICKIT